MIVLLVVPLLVGCFLLPPKNQDPIITSAPVIDAIVGQVYTYNVEATDPDGDPLTYALPVAPDGMEISVEGIISWTPVVTGSYEVTVEVSDGKTSIAQTFTIEVNEQASTTSPPSAIDIENVAKNILETQDNGREYFEQLMSQEDPDALQKTVDFLKIQPNVDDVEIGEDNVTIWIFYKSGVEGIIFTEPYRVTCGLPKAGTYRSNLATVTRETTLTDKKAVIISPFFNSCVYISGLLDEIPIYLQQSGYSPANIELCADENVSVNFMQTLSEYDFIYMSTHGSVRPTYQDATILTGEQATYSLMHNLWSYLTNNKIQVGTVDEINYFALSSKFFADYSYPGSIVHVDACLTLQNDTMANVFLNNGAKVYLGWTEKTYTNLCSIYSTKLYHELARSNNTLQQAYSDTYDSDFPISIYKDKNEDGWPGMLCASGKQLGDPSETTFDYTLYFEFRGDPQFVLNPSSIPETYTITASTGPNGSISPSGEISVNHGSEQSFAITPNIGYIVEDVMVDGSSIGAVDTYTFTNITQNHTISVTFSTIETTVDITAALTWNHALPLQEGVLYERWIQLQWESYPGAIGYNIYRRVNQGDYNLFFQYYPEHPYNIFSDADVSIGNSYDYYITAYGTNWETFPSEVKHLDTWLPCPYLISPVDNSTITDPNPTFTWDPVGISNFPYGNIYSGSSAFFVHQHIAEDSIDICRIDFPDLITSNATYYQDENAYPLIPENNYFFNTLAWGFDSSGSLIAISCSHIWEFYYAGDGDR